MLFKPPKPPKHIQHEGDPLEATIENKVCRYAEGKGLTQFKFKSPQRASLPDRIFLWKGGCFFIEFKRLGKLPTPAQREKINAIRAAGVKVYVVDSYERGRDVIDAYTL